VTDADKKAQEILEKAKEQVEDQQFVLSGGKLRELEQKESFLITSAQNNTTVHKDVLETFHRVADHYDAQLMVIPVRYKNPTGYDPEMQGKNDQWSASLHQYMVENQVRLHRKLVVLGDWRLQATTQRPLTGLGPITGASSGIVGHGRLQMHTVATPSADLAKMMYTTGSVTRPNYSDTGLGQKGKFHHTQGAVLVRKSGKFFHIRHLNWSEHDKSIHDINLRFTPKGVEEVGFRAIVTGDEHAIFADQNVKNATYGDGGLVDLGKPEFIIRHDVHDSYANSHHHSRDPVIKYVKAKVGYNDVKWELDLTKEHIDSTTPEYAQNIMVASNHHEHLMRWLKEADPKEDPKNAPLYHKLMGLVLEQSEMRAGGVWSPDVFMLYCTQLSKMRSNTRFLERTEPFKLFDIALHLHGDKGPDGRWGSGYVFAQMGIKSVTAHTHRPWIMDGNYCVGHSSEAEREYVHGPSSWLPTHCLIHHNGKRQLVHIIMGEF